MTSEQLDIGGKPFTGYRIPTENGTILLIAGDRAHLGCGYFKIGTADKINDRFAVVTGVKTFGDMLKAAVVEVSAAARERGVLPGDSGETALLKMEG